MQLLSVRLAILPAAKENADPFEGQRPDGGVGRFSFGTLLLVIRFRPGARADGMPRPLVKGLPYELRTSPAPMHPKLFAAAGHHGAIPL